MKKLTKKQAKKAMNLESLCKSLFLSLLLAGVVYFLVEENQKIQAVIFSFVFAFTLTLIIFGSEFRYFYYDLSKWIVIKDNLVVKGEWIKQEKKDFLKAIRIENRFNSFSEGISMSFLHENNLLLDIRLIIVFDFAEDAYQKLYNIGGLNYLLSPKDKLTPEITSWLQDIRIGGSNLFSKIFNQYRVDEEINNLINSCFERSRLNNLLKIKEVKIQL